MQRAHSLWRAILAALTLLALAAPVARAQPPALVVQLLDAGAGDAAWLTTPGGGTILVDCGPSSYGKTLVLQLQAAGVQQVDLLAVSNSHADAVGGCVEVLRRMPVGRVLLPPMDAGPPAWEMFRALLASSGTQVTASKAGDAFDQGGVRLTVLNPSERGPGSALSEYDDSQVLLVEYAGNRILFAGDIHSGGEQQVLAGASSDLARVAVLRVADHGSQRSSSQAFLDVTRPQLAVVSFGNARGAQTPDRDTLDRLRRSAAQVLTTAERGTVTVEAPADGSRVRVSAAG